MFYYESHHLFSLIIFQMSNHNLLFASALYFNLKLLIKCFKLNKSNLIDGLKIENTKLSFIN